mgnify:CR=1 FL=1
MTTEAIISVPEYLNWTTRVTGKGPNQKNTGWVLSLQTPLPGSNYQRPGHHDLPRCRWCPGDGEALQD